jgi:hypothetical protein
MEEEVVVDLRVEPGLHVVTDLFEVHDEPQRVEGVGLQSDEGPGIVAVQVATLPRVA